MTQKKGLKSEYSREETASVQLCSPQIPWDWTRPFAMRG